MDYFSHGFWAYIIFHRIKKWYYAVLFGLLPDTLSWGIYLVYSMITGFSVFRQPGPPRIDLIPDWVFMLYGISHSLIVFGIVILFVYLFLKRIPVYMYAWPIAVLMDIPTHSREFLPTPFLWPISDWKFPGFSWGVSWFMILNYSFILFFLIYIFVTRNHSKKKLKN
ncbi:hypothetical protein ACFL0W_00695 [Nanoarchaeota archaeon]